MGDMEIPEISASDFEKDPFSDSDDSVKDPDYGREIKKKKIPDYFGLHRRCEASTSRTRSTSPETSSVSMEAQSSCESRSETEVVEECSPLFDGTYYKITEKGSNFAITAQCQKCIPKSKYIKGRSNATTNFLKHIKTKHPQELQNYLDYKKYKRSANIAQCRRTQTTASSCNEPTAINKKKQLDLKSSFLGMGQKISQEQFDKRIVKFITNTMSALSIIENDSFIQLFDGLNIKVMSRKTAVRRISESCKTMLENIKINLEPVQYICTTADVWSCKKRSFLGVTCHWINPVTYERRSAALACRRFSGTHSFDRIAELIDDIHSTFGLRSEKITATVTDNGSNFIKAFKEYGVNIPCSVVLDALMPCEMEPAETDDNVTKDLEELADVLFTPNSINPDTITTTGEDEQELSNIQLPRHQRCISHTINLIATTDLMKSINKSLAMRSRHTNILNKCSQLWTKAGRPKSAEIIKEILGHHLSYPGITRWNSHYDSINQILADKEKLPTLYEKLSIKQYSLKENEVEYLIEFVKVLKPLALALDILQGDTNIYFGYAIPTIASMRIKVEKLKNLKLKYFATVVDDLLLAISKRFEEYLTFKNKHAMLAAISNPAFKMRWIVLFKAQEPQISEDLKRMFISACEELTLTATETTETWEIPKEKAFNDFFEFDYENDNNLLPAFATKRGELESLQYLQDPHTELAMLDKYPVVQKLFLKYNTTLPSSAPVERMFSYATFIDTPRRHALSDQNFENLVLMKANANNNDLELEI